MSVHGRRPPAGQILCRLLGVKRTRYIVRSPQKRHHDPIEYYRGWGGYSHPIALQNKITKEAAEAIAAEGSAYLIGHFGADGKLTRVVKMLRGSVFFDFVYEYHPNGKRKTATVTNAKGIISVRHYDKRGRGLPGNPLFW
jgi:hypothetical protein